MQRSDSIAELVTALAKAQAEFEGAVKDAKNPAFNSKYADLAAVINAVRPSLNRHGIVMLQACESDLERQTASVTTSLHFKDEWLAVTKEAPAIGRDGKFNVQTMGATWTYLKRYGLQGLCGLPSEDDDGNSVASDNAPIPKLVEKPAGPTRAQIAEREAEYATWQKLFESCKTVDQFNKIVVPERKIKGRDFAKAAGLYARAQGWVPNKEATAYENPVKEMFQQAVDATPEVG